MAPFGLADREVVQLEALLVDTPHAREVCRLQALLWLAEGETVAEVADRLRVSRRTVYYWVERFQQRADLDLCARLQDAPRSGRPPTALDVMDPLIEEIIDLDPRDFGYHATAWTVPLLQHYLRAVHQRELSPTSISRAIDRLDLRWKRPRHQLARRPDTWRQSKGGSKEASRIACARSC
jgi:transposase